MGETYDFEQFDSTNPIISDKETKSLKTKCTMEMLSENDIYKLNNKIAEKKHRFIDCDSNLFVEHDAENKIKNEFP
jgi:hypothetical protein